MNIAVELRHLRYFVAVAEELSLTRAARRLNTVSPSLGNQIRQLEELVGTTLLHREGHHLALTEAGRLMLSEARRILEEVGLVLEKVQCAGEAEAARLSIGVYHGAEWRVFPRLLPFMRAQCPLLDLRFRTMNPVEMLDALRMRTIDAAIMRGPVCEPEIATERVLTDRIMAVVPARHPLARLKRIPLDELAELPFVIISQEVAPQLRQLVSQIAEDAGVQIRASVETENMLSTVITVDAVSGFSLLPQYVERILPKTVVARPLAISPPPTGPLIAAYRTGNTQPNLTLFLQKLLECFQDEAEIGPLIN